VAEKLPVSASYVLSLDDPFNANVLKNPPAALKQNWMIVDKEDASGHGVEILRPSLAAQYYFQYHLAPESLSSRLYRDQ
jgi:hypothetical protein